MLITDKNVSKLYRLKKSKKIVMCHGVFDVLHYGHILHLKEAKSLGDILVVSINDDDFVDKGIERPIFDSLTRANTLLSLEHVDYVYITKNFTAVNALKKIKPNFYVKDQEYKKKSNLFNSNFQKEIKVAKQKKIKLIFTKQLKLSSSDIISKKFNKYTLMDFEKFNKIKLKYNYLYFKNLIDKIKDVELCLIGDPIIDEYVYVETTGIASKTPALASKFKKKELYMGGVFAVAQMATLLGAKVNLITYLDNTIQTNNILKKLSKKINVIKIKSNFKVPLISRIVNDGKNEHLHQIYNFKNFAHDKKTSLKLKKELRKYKKKECHFVLIDFGFNFLNDNIINSINRKYLSINTHKNSLNSNHNYISKYKNPAYFSINFSEYLSDKKMNIEKEPKKIIEYLKNNELRKKFSITLGNKGSIFKNNKNIEYSPAFITKTLDTTGSGDAYFILTSMLNLLSVPDELIPFIANIYAGLHGNIIGNKDFVTKEQLLRDLKYLML